MPYLVIARKYRPQSFSDVVGQEHITTTITRAIEKGRLAHAYLFAGPRGVGKTTTARILAKSVNCEKGPTAEPCNSCSSCAEITEGIHLDVIEIDGASNRGIDDVRELRERVRYSPARGRRKVYIIDEVHMLTAEAFNALLKTLEEPPDHALFIFATTEPHKLPSTILSRCQRFDFRLIPPEEIIKHLKWITSREEVRVADEALKLIAARAAGCLRDAQSMLDQLIAFGSESDDKELDKALVEELLGVVDEEVYFRIGAALFKGELGPALAEMRGLLNRGYDLGEITRGFIGYLGSLILAGLEAGDLAGRQPAADLGQRLRTEMPEVTPDDLLRASEILTATEREMARSTQPELILELAFVRIARMGKTVEIGKILERLDQLAEGAAGLGPVQTERREAQPDLFDAPSQPAAPRRKPEPVGEKTYARPAEAADRAEEPEGAGEDGETVAPPLDLEIIRARWSEFIERINHHRGSVGASLEAAEIVDLEEDVLLLGFGPENHFQRERIEELSVRQTIEQALGDFFGRPVRIRCTVVESDDLREGGESEAGEAAGDGSFEREPIINKTINLLDLERLPGG